MHSLDEGPVADFCATAPPMTNTGDAVMNRMWTALHVTAVAVPFRRADDGKPLGRQLVAGLGTDRALIKTAQWFDERAATDG